MTGMLDKMKNAVRAIDDELLSAEHYAKMAQKCKGSDNAAMQTYIAMAKQELSHIDALSDMARRTLNEAKDKQDPCLRGVEAIWELESERMTSWLVKIKMLMDGM